MERDYQICSNCIMDTTDSTIIFDDNGLCEYCNNYHSNIVTRWDTGKLGERKLFETVKK